MSTPNTEPLVTDADITKAGMSQGDASMAINGHDFAAGERSRGYINGAIDTRKKYETHRKEWEADRAELIRQRQWISVEERLPKPGEFVDVFVVQLFSPGVVNSDRHTDAILSESGTWVIKFRVVPPEWNITHWMPLPEPPPQQR